VFSRGSPTTPTQLGLRTQTMISLAATVKAANKHPKNEKKPGPFGSHYSDPVHDSAVAVHAVNSNSQTIVVMKINP